MIRLNRPVLPEGTEEAVLQVLRSGQLAQGPWVERLEDMSCAMTGSPHAVAVSNGTAALETAFHVHGIGPGDEVITTPLTFVATLNSIWHTGATVRFADVRPDLTLDPASVEALIGPRTAAVVPVHLYGLPADMPALQEIAGRYSLLVVEDAAQAHGATAENGPVGACNTATFSFYATKNVTAGEGGVVTLHDAQLARRARLFRNQGMSKRYEYEAIGRNLRMSDLHAAIAVMQMQSLETTTRDRAEVARCLTKHLSSLATLALPTEPSGRQSAWHQYTVLLPVGTDRDHVRQRMARRLVDTGVYYPSLAWDHPAHRASERIVQDDTPVAASVVERCLSLPVHPGVRGHESRVATALAEAMDETSIK